jgi:autoinducer 2-degrading protein
VIIEGARVGSLLVVQVDVQVLPGCEEAFKAATLANARASRLEAGVVRFDVLEDRTQPTHFVLVEVFKDAAASEAHKGEEHYRAWRDAVGPLMAQPRSGVKFVNVDPPDNEWA